MKLQLRLRDLREDNDMSQAEMAKLLGCSQQTYSRYESHTTEIPLESLIFRKRQPNPAPPKNKMSRDQPRLKSRIRFITMNCSELL